MMKLIRFDEDHYGYLVGSDVDLSMAEADVLKARFEAVYPDKRLLVIRADEFIDLTGQYEVVQVAEPVA